MKVKAISRIEEDYTRECKSDILKVHRNLDPALHPMHRAVGAVSERCLSVSVGSA